MARKTNKTEHVLNILTKNKVDTQDETDEISQNVDVPITTIEKDKAKSSSIYSPPVEIEIKENLLKTLTNSTPKDSFQSTIITDAPVSTLIVPDFSTNTESEEKMSHAVEIENKQFIENISEQVVLELAPEYMEKICNCSCNCCFYDVVALSLNQLPSKYMRTINPIGNFLKTSYKIKYSHQIMVAITKACVTVNDKPRH